MKPTRSKSLDSTSFSYIQDLLGRILTEREKIEVDCFWAGQTGHEGCGYCLGCSRPRSLKVKGCEHPLDKVYKGEG